MTTTIPLKPFKIGPISSAFGGPAQSSKEVLERARIALSPRGSWRKRGFTGNSYEGSTRCLFQVISDVDGIHAAGARGLLLRAAKEITGVQYSSVESFNDADATQKHHVIMALDRAIELAP